MSVAQKRAVLAEADLFIRHLILEAQSKQGMLSKAEEQKVAEDGIVQFIMQMGPRPSMRPRRMPPTPRMSTVDATPHPRT
jgi:hypothetical protein